MSTGDESSPGNFGLKDQVLALKWVKRNIKAFGGDPNSITLLGASAGAVSVHMHMLSPMSEGLFNRGILMSGLATAPYNEPTPHPLALAKRQAEVVGIENIDHLSTTELVNKLRDIDVSVLMNSVGELKLWSVDPITLYRPVIESQPNGAFMQEHPAITWSRGTFKHIPWMTGIVPNDGSVRAAAIITNKELLDDLNSNLEKLLPKLMEISPAESANLPLIVKRLKEFYLNGSSIIKQSHEQGFLNVSRNEMMQRESQLIQNQYFFFNLQPDVHPSRFPLSILQSPRKLHQICKYNRESRLSLQSKLNELFFVEIVFLSNAIDEFIFMFIIHLN